MSKGIAFENILSTCIPMLSPTSEFYQRFKIADGPPIYSNDNKNMTNKLQNFKTTRLATLITNIIKKYTIPDELDRKKRLPILSSTSKFYQRFPTAEGPQFYQRDSKNMAKKVRLYLP